MDTDWQVRRKGETVTEILVNSTRNAEWEQWALVTADRHLDNPESDRRLQKRHLDLAVERNAFVIDIGDCFCLMQGKSDRRGQKSKVMEQHREDDYLGSIIRDGVEFFRPYAKHLAMFSPGNHETAITKNIEFDPTRAFIDRMSDIGSQVQMGAYSGWVLVKFQAANRSSVRNDIYYTHGSGGGGPVTRGVIKTNRRQCKLGSVDIVLSGHVHEAWMVEIMQESVNHNGNVEISTVTHLQVPTYKDETRGRTGWAIEKEFPHKPQGAWWIRWFWDRGKGAAGGYDYEITRAK